MSIRVRLIVLTLLAIAPLMLERFHGLEKARAERTARAYSDVVDLARRGAEAQREIITSVRALLQMVSRVYARVPFEAPECSQYLTDLTADIPWLRDVSIAAPDGRIKCSTQPVAVGLNVSDRPHFQNALNARDFALSDYIINHLHQAPSVVATLPIMRDDGSIEGVVLAVVNLQWVGNLAATAAQHLGASVMLMDGAGTLIAGSPDQHQFIGKPGDDQALDRAIHAGEEGMLTAPGFDGINRILAYVPVPWTKAHLAVGLDELAVHRDIDRTIDTAYLQLGLFTLFVLLIAWFGGEHLVVRPIRSLVRTAGRFGRGDLHVRASREPCVAEFAPLAAALDDMAAKLAAREEELRIANEHLEELASLDGLSGLANRRAFDCGIEREWQRGNELRKPVALMMVDIDHFKLFNDRYGHVTGDGCLRAVGETLSLITLEDAVMVARYGGEEFALLLPGLDIQRAAMLAEDARRAIEDLAIDHSESPSGRVTISVGVAAMVPEKYRTVADLVEAADGALYAAKGRGRNTVVVHAPPLLRAVS